MSRIVSSVALVLVTLLLPCSNLHADDRPIVVFREDDIRATWRIPFQGFGGVSALDYGKSKHIPVTWGVISDRASIGGPSALTWAELRDYMTTAGGEAASHSAAHVAMPDDDAYIDELTKSKADIEANLPGFSCTTFYQPGTWTGDAYFYDLSKLSNPIGLALQSTYERSQAYLGSGWIVGPIFRKHGLSNTYAVDFQSCSSIPAMQATLDIVAATPGLVFTIACHGVQETGGTTEYEVQADMMKALMDRLADLRDSGKVRLMSMHDAYIASESFSKAINHIPDPGMEVCNPGPLNPANPWKLGGGACVVSGGGVDGSRYGSLKTGTDALTAGTLGLAPGRYELSWYQKPEAGFPTDKGLLVWAESVGHQTTAFDSSGAYYYNKLTPIDWERKTALFMIDDKRPWTEVSFRPQQGGGYCVDNVSLVSIPLDPAVSPSGTTAAVTPTRLTLSWHTPPSAAGGTIKIRYSALTAPIAPSEGTRFGEIPAVADSPQSASMGISWPSYGLLCISVFAVAADGTYTRPDMLYVMIDKVGPTAPSISCVRTDNGAVAASWSSTDTHDGSGVYGYQYCLGTAPGKDDLAPSTFTTETGASIILPAADPGRVYLSVMAQNLYGYWSATSSVTVAQITDIGSALASNDGDSVTVSGRVAAVFSDGLYIEALNRTRGVKVTGLTGYREGDGITVTGVLSTVDGERCVAVSGP